MLSQGAVTGVLQGKEEQGPADKVSLEFKGREEGLPASPRRHRGLEGREGSGWVGKELPATPEPEHTNLPSISAGEGGSCLTPR